MSKRRKNKRSSDTASKTKVRDIFVARPFEGLTSEVNWVAMRELLPAATASLRLKPEYAEKANGRPVTLATVLPLAWPAMSRADGHIFIAAQRQFQSGDISRDLAASLIAALDTKPGEQVAVPARPGPGPRIQDLIENEPLDVTIHDTFDFWLADDTDASQPHIQASMERANSSIYPSAHITAMDGAYWCYTPEHVHVRIALPDGEDEALNALARLRSDNQLKLIDDSKFAGMFRTHGILVPVWDLDPATKSESCETPVKEFAERYRDALANTEPLSVEQRRSRDGLVGRQLTLR